MKKLLLRQSLAPLKILGHSLSVPVHLIPSEKRDFRNWNLPSPFSLAPDTPPPSNHVLITASFGRILPLAMLSQFHKTQRLNVHPSLLPAYRGPAPIQHALMRGEQEVGVCIIGMLPVKKKGGGGGIDAGDIWGCTRRDVPEGIDFVQLREMLAKDGGRLLVNVLRDMAEGTAKAIPQPAETQEPHAPMISQADWTIDFSLLTAEEVIWRHRAISHQRNLTVSIPTDPIRTVQLIAVAASTDPSLSQRLPTTPGAASFHKTRGLLVRCKDGTILEVTKLKQEGKKEMDAKDWWNGVKESYFATQPPPTALEHDVQRVREWTKKQVAAGRRVVLVTSGGTTVPLELNVMLPFTGTRGATSAEYFLKAGYAVIFMHRQFSLQPFSRHYSHSTNPFLDFLEIENDGDTPGSSPRISVTQEKRADLLEVLRIYKEVHVAETMLTLTFVTVNDYLWLLRAVSQELSTLGRKALYYLAAAVSDFFLPRQKMSVHKIQSGKGSLHIEMDQVPKILKPMVDEWSPDGYIVSFKLETDQELLIPKARAALERYGHQVVIGNDLHRRKFEVVFVSRNNDPTASEDSQFIENWLRIDPALTHPGIEQIKEIEEDIIAELVKKHTAWIQAQN
ncbi:hypothetical protein NP233_g10838 [Leucocoprinus birnbaumii]|uniref:Methionyl-tRNA formyltransferase n=1 Tax=Leucocoprinus birnbaumii TaxID=56174 RepID=A0AAD5VHP0_9AGAR|nr:hypothetical protein NP233_g10838 [Leucocoprinus birnbaumii]